MDSECVCTLSRVHSIVYPLHGLQQYPYFLSPNTVDYISSHTATSFNTSDRGFPLHFPALILFCLLHWATLSLLSTTCWVSSSATKKMHIYIYYIILPQKYWRCNHTRARSGQTEKTRFRGLFTCNILSVRVSLERWEQLSWRIAEFCRFDSGADPNTGSAVLLWWTCQDKGTSRCWDVRVCATEAEQHNKGVVTAREEFPRDRRM